jgi:hypothetical protein
VPAGKGRSPRELDPAPAPGLPHAPVVEPLRPARLQQLQKLHKKRLRHQSLQYYFSTTKAPPPPLTTTPTVPLSFSKIVLRPKSPSIVPTTPTLASAIEGMASAVKKHQTESLSLLHSSAGPGKKFEKRLALLRKVNISHLVEASACVRAAGGTSFLLEMLFEIARSKEKEARRIYAMDGLVASTSTDAPTIYSSITDSDGFTAVCVRGGKSSSPPKQ